MSQFSFQDFINVTMEFWKPLCYPRTSIYDFHVRSANYDGSTSIFRNFSMICRLLSYLFSLLWTMLHDNTMLWLPLAALAILLFFKSHPHASTRVLESTVSQQTPSTPSAPQTASSQERIFPITSYAIPHPQPDPKPKPKQVVERCAQNRLHRDHGKLSLSTNSILFILLILEVTVHGRCRAGRFHRYICAIVLDGCCLAD
jgi:hypothetical protein